MKFNTICGHSFLFVRTLGIHYTRFWHEKITLETNCHKDDNSDNRTVWKDNGHKNEQIRRQPSNNHRQQIDLNRKTSRNNEYGH